MKPRRGEVWVIDIGTPVGHEQAGRRPAVIVSPDLLNQGPSGVVIVVPLTTTRRDLPSHVEIDVGESGLDHVSYAKCEDVKSISEAPRHQARLVPPEPMFAIGRIPPFPPGHLI
ncbi:MAG TPA: type II toxin-antitoxin system PemK/MazF family toxin [Acidimicrobiales bacterium]|nr:type II toxin-antitoxin system PemK/MazF family toxin [Acidimicrobiales bacterium]